MQEIRELDAARDESYRALQLCVELAEHKRAADVKAAATEVEKGTDYFLYEQIRG